ncbi:MAG: LysE family translocator [Bacteroidetes bacterium]|nr:LysE family translocator [Bacteroidota bacterium]
MIDNYIIYITLAFTVTAIPGPAVVLTIKNSIKYGYKVAIANILGNFTAMVILASISAAGLGALIMASSTLFSVLKVLGCMYLVYLGIKTWKSPYNEENLQSQSTEKDKIKVLSVFRQGFGVGIANPKAIAFFTALFPQFIDPAGTFLPQFLTLIFTIEGISFIVLSSYALLSSFASQYLSQKKPMTFFNRLSGTAFIGFGLALIFKD